MPKLNLFIKFTLILLLAVAGGFLVLDRFEFLQIHKIFPFRLGLDLQGGTHLVYEGDLKDITPQDRGAAMSSVRDVIERRVNAFGIAEPVVSVAGTNRLIVELPGIKDIAGAVKQIGLTPFLEFREENPDYHTEEETMLDFARQYRPTGLTGKNLRKSEIVFDPTTNSPEISLQFDDQGKKLFSDITERNVGKTVAIFLDGGPISAPVVQQKITAGRAVITGKFTIDQAKELAQRLNAGALPVPIKLLQQQNIGPTLGKISLQHSIVAGIIGFLAVALFMIIYYRLAGVSAVLALLVYVIITLSIFKLLPVTLTLAGIAGFILSVGMAVDANILVFERTREELRSGHDLSIALEEGFRRAWTAIRDSNVSSLITVFILGYFGTSLIRGFAITLGVGILVSMFSALTVTRIFLRFFYSFTKPKTNQT